MAYTNQQPSPTQLISQGQSTILANFVAIDIGTTQMGIGFARNHVTMTDATNGGLHNRIDFYQNISAPTITGAFVSSLYPVAGASELQYTNGGGTTQITSAGLAIWKGGSGTGVVTDTNAGTGAMNLPNGIQFRWGSASVNTAGTVISYSAPFTNGTYSVTLTPISSTARPASLNTQTANGFTAYSDQNGVFMFYFSVGH